MFRPVVVRRRQPSRLGSDGVGGNEVATHQLDQRQATQPPGSLPGILESGCVVDRRPEGLAGGTELQSSEVLETSGEVHVGRQLVVAAVFGVSSGPRWSRDHPPSKSNAWKWISASRPTASPARRSSARTSSSNSSRIEVSTRAPTDPGPIVTRARVTRRAAVDHTSRSPAARASAMRLQQAPLRIGRSWSRKWQTPARSASWARSRRPARRRGVKNDVEVAGRGSPRSEGVRLLGGGLTGPSPVASDRPLSLRGGGDRRSHWPGDRQRRSGVSRWSAMSRCIRCRRRPPGSLYSRWRSSG